MHVVVGPVESGSAIAWADYAEGVLLERADEVPDDVREAFGGYLAEWREQGAAGPTLVWETEVPVEVGEYLVLAFYRLAQRIDADRPSADQILPVEVVPFYQALVDGLLAAMEETGAGAAEFADHLRGFWPRPDDPED